MRGTLVALCVALAGCATTSSNSTNNSNSSGAAGEPVVAAGARVVVASLERGACFGRCPVYTLKVWSDGTLEFDGKRFTASGQVKDTVTPAQLAALTQAFATAKFDELKTEYADTRVSDMPWNRVSNGTKTVRHYLGDESAPASLKELEDAIDRIVKVKQWVAGPEQ